MDQITHDLRLSSWKAVIEQCQARPAAPFVEIPAQEIFTGREITAVTIKTKKSTIEISAAVPDALMVELVKAVSHAL